MCTVINVTFHILLKHALSIQISNNKNKIVIRIKPAFIKPIKEEKNKYAFTTVTIVLYYLFIIFVAYFQENVFTSCSGLSNSLFLFQGCLQRKLLS